MQACTIILQLLCLWLLFFACVPTPPLELYPLTLYPACIRFLCKIQALVLPTTHCTVVYYAPFWNAAKIYKNHTQFSLKRRPKFKKRKYFIQKGPSFSLASDTTTTYRNSNSFQLCTSAISVKANWSKNESIAFVFVVCCDERRLQQWSAHPKYFSQQRALGCCFLSQHTIVEHEFLSLHSF